MTPQQAMAAFEASCPSEHQADIGGWSIWHIWTGGKECPIPDKKAGEYQLVFKTNYGFSEAQKQDADYWRKACWTHRKGTKCNKIVGYRFKLSQSSTAQSTERNGDEPKL